MKRNVIIVTLLGAVTLGACGDSPEAMQQALAETAPTLAYVDDSGADCAGDAILSTVGYDVLTAAGYTSGQLLADTTAVETIVDDYGSPDLLTALTNCLDIDQAFRSELVAHAGNGADDSVVCDYEFSADDSLVSQYLESRYEGDLPFDVEDTPEHRDLLRPCLSEDAFAQQFDLDRAEELASAIQAALPSEVAALPCAGSSVVDQIGAEALNDLGVRTATPDIRISTLGLPATERGELLDVIAGCSDIDTARRTELRSEEPVFGQCALDANLDAWKASAVASALGQRPNRETILLEEELRGCAHDRAEAIVGIEFEPREQQAIRLSARYLLPTDEAEAAVTATQSMMECATGVVIGELGLERYDELFDGWALATTDEEFWPAFDLFLAEILPARLACEGASVLVNTELYRLGFSQETIDCINRFIGGPEVLAQSNIDLYRNGEPTQQEVNSYWNGIALWEEGLELCHTPAEDSKLAALYELQNQSGVVEDESF